MSDKTGRNAFYVVIFAVGSLGVLVLGGGYLCGYDMLNATACYNIVLDDCQQLTVGNAVFLKGYKVGNISAVVFDKKNLRFRVVFCIDKDIKVTRDSSVVVCTSLLGNKSLILSVGTGEVVKPGYTLYVDHNEGDLESGLLSVVNETKSVLQKVDVFLKSVNDDGIVDNCKSLLGTVGNTMKNLNSLITDFKINPKKYIRIF